MAKRETKKRNKGSAGNNRKSGEDFLNNNLKKEGVFETQNGLQYMIVEETKNARPVHNSIITIHQRILLLNGNILADTYRDNQPEEVEISELIEGLQEGLQMMPKGSRFKFWIPSELAWGKKGTGNKIPPFAVLFCDIRLIDFY